MTAKHRLLSCVLTVVPIAASFVTSAPSALACGSAVFRDVDEDAVRLERAQLALEEGDYREARQLAAMSASGGRADWLWAMSYVRDEKASQTQLEAAVATLRGIHARRGAHDVVTRVDLGEALTRIQTREAQREALAILEPLAKADLVGSPHAYAQLVRVGSSLGVRVTSFRRCREMADDPSLCTTGFIEEARSRRWRSTHVWGERFFNLLALAAIGGVVSSGALIFARRKRRAAALAAFADGPGGHKKTLMFHPRAEGP